MCAQDGASDICTRWWAWIVPEFLVNDAESHVFAKPADARARLHGRDRNAERNAIRIGTNVDSAVTVSACVRHGSVGCGWRVIWAGVGVRRYGFG